jgi:hypothetical protein
MRNSEPPRRGFIPPTGAECLRANYEELYPSPPPFTKHKELSSFLAEDSTKIFLTFISFSLTRSRILSEKTGTEAILPELNSRMPKHLNRIFGELKPEAREAIFALREKIAEYSAALIPQGNPQKTENLERTIWLARTAGKDAEGRHAAPRETALIVCGVFAASARVFQFQKERTSLDFIKLTEKISLEMSSQTLISFLWKIADSRSDPELSTTLAEISRVHGNERKIIELLSS